MTSKEKVILPQGRRKHKIIFKVKGNNEYNEGGELDKVVSNMLGGIGLFD